MVGNRQMHELIGLAEKVNARVVLMGDTKQLSPVEAGRIFSKLQETKVINTVTMKDVVRQKAPLYRAIVKDVSQTKIDRAFDKLHKHEKVYEIPDKEVLKKRLVSAYTAKDNYQDSLIVTADNKDRKELNTSIRQCLKEKGRLSQKEYQYITRESQSNNSFYVSLK